MNKLFVIPFSLLSFGSKAQVFSNPTATYGVKSWNRDCDSFFIKKVGDFWYFQGSAEFTLMTRIDSLEGRIKSLEELYKKEIHLHADSTTYLKPL